ncbi:uncharacterized protein PFL1_00219 [Pseudozyma flocculosa PF-1]|uniref:TLC domain-containing protein n=1 Tax=Pseudozyma flocculosa TaxID=84751 RepID=A0A5C3ERW4_9BASI|nr:uncharacterized protein PFL1_00219 [Pseudozyma flocculosa PF-1]EPQ32021.1 hypothetical protein PFL1_00219 [Pseudozyma flocculosa PF-1]SPO35053.1 uncharacterized protein PSFLO_00524 [Pseudozyma flocculosa]
MGLATDLSPWLQPYADQLNVPHMPTHLQTILRSVLLWTSLQLLSSGLSPRLFPKTFATFSKKTRTSWDIHFVAFCHAVVITPLCARIWWKVRQQGNSHPLAVDRLYGYDYEAGEVYAVALGYFIWDSYISIRHEGPGFVAHGLVAFTAFILVYYPVFMYDGLGFLLWELSTPFLNIHWFLDKLGMTGTTLQLVNAVFLLGTYVGARLTFGVYNSISFFKFVVSPPTPHHPPIPRYIANFYMTGNVILNSLNFFWFRAMVRAVQKRFTAKPKPAEAGAIDPKKVLRGQQGVSVGVRGNDDEPFEREAGVIKGGKSQ